MRYVPLSCDEYRFRFMLSLKKRETKSFIYFACNFNITLKSTVTWSHCLLSGFMMVNLKLSGKGRGGRLTRLGWDRTVL